MLSAFLMLDAGREMRHRFSILVLQGMAGLIAIFAVFFALQAAQLQLSEMMSPVLASLCVAACLFGSVLLIMLIAASRTRKNRSGAQIGQAMIASVPLANAVAQKASPQLLIAAMVLGAAVFLGNRMGRKN